MIHGVLSAMGVVEESKTSAIPGALLFGDPSLPTAFSSSSSSPSSVSSHRQPSPAAAAAASEPLRCPRCDSSNTKFCYYNNYNLTQPRHFCKTCRRYWTKGGALRNVPIGGGCRKAKASPTTSTTAAAIPTKPGGVRSMPQPNPFVWAAPPAPELMALLRATGMTNPNMVANNVTGPLNLSSGHLGQVPIGLGRVSSPQPQLHGLMGGEVQRSSGYQNLHQWLKPDQANCYSDQLQELVSNVGGLESTNAAAVTELIMEPIPLAAVIGVEPGCWNPAPLSWSDLQTVNGTFP